MRKVLMISGLALAMAGCASQQDSPGQVPVRDLSASRSDTAASHYTVAQGDTLYGIAWRHDMDYRDLARLNRIGPPYEIQPGQRLVLEGGAGEGLPAARQTDDGASAMAVATPLGGAQAEADSGDMEWLLPSGETETVSRADRATDSGDVDQAQAASDEESGPGPVYSPDSPGADGYLSERDLAERSAREDASEAEQTAEASQEAEEASNTRDVAETAAPEEPAQEVASEAPSEEAQETDAGTAVAGGTQGADRGSRTYTPVAEVPWQWPASGNVVGQFGDGGAITAGIDIAGQKGQPVKAAGPGIVVYAGSGVRGYGKLILLKHNDQFLSAYAHNDTLQVSENDVVEAGEVIATMGDSDAEDVRLHFEVRKDGQPQDPLDYLPSR
ncbi:peptidoglycan DD-metalloendopeptidase family protein [Halomonas sp. G15]|uniref:peptidoglycan DD-metalloendopeptidase family protein n=1 Tax=Halomonas sp. G15 TaxID=2903521 RepID=UPI001E29CD1F|nr:peptidoglycan DD-metalloendopeptidase family protein [Halomonas sp. G15]MCE0733028.1 peptidoglycan DD-metalloendopeptidase family protein [Halomonas sp. G15]